MKLGLAVYLQIVFIIKPDTNASLGVRLSVVETRTISVDYNIAIRINDKPFGVVAEFFRTNNRIVGLLVT